MIIINANVSDDVIATLINDMFEDMFNEWEWEQEHAQEIEDKKYLQKLAKDMQASYEDGDMDRFMRIWDFYSDVYKDIYNVRPHWFLESQSWFHGF